MPRRRMTTEVLGRAIRLGELPPGIDVETAIDMLYAPIYYRFQIGTGPISDAYTDDVFEQVMKGLRAGWDGAGSRGVAPRKKLQ